MFVPTASVNGARGATGLAEHSSVSTGDQLELYPKIFLALTLNW